MLAGARLLGEGGFVDVAEKSRGTVVLALSIIDRDSILRALDDPPSDALSELRPTLLVEHE